MLRLLADYHSVADVSYGRQQQVRSIRSDTAVHDVNYLAHQEAASCQDALSSVRVEGLVSLATHMFLPEALMLLAAALLFIVMLHHVDAGSDADGGTRVLQIVSGRVGRSAVESCVRLRSHCSDGQSAIATIQAGFSMTGLALVLDSWLSSAPPAGSHFTAWAPAALPERKRHLVQAIPGPQVTRSPS